jgi:hypothetical protein
MNNKGNIFQLPIILMGLILVIAILTSLLPAMTELLNTAKASNALNCPGYDYNSTDKTLSYNISKPTSTIGCMAINLYIPYIVLGVLIASVAVLFGQKIAFGGQDTISGQGYY